MSKRIPIANVYYLLCYAWRHAEEMNVIDVGSLEGVEHVHYLLGQVLAEGTFQLVRRGLDRGYVEVREELAGVRGKLELGEMAKRALRARGRTSCLYEELSHDVTHNRILKSTLDALLRISNLDSDVRAKVRAAHRKLEGITVIRLDRHVFRQVQLDRNRRMYLFLMSICALIHEHLVVDQVKGDIRFVDFRDDYERMWELFEEFVQEFYRRESSYRVNARGRRIRWAESRGASDADRALIPKMTADVILERADRRIVLDTKYYRQPLSYRFGRPKLRSGNLYQLLAYLRNREATVPSGPKHEGVLLYPVVEGPVRADIELEGFRIQARGIDLTQDWRKIHSDLLSFV